MRIRNFIVTLLVLAAAGYGGLKLYSYNKVKTGVDFIVETMAPVATLEYEMISTSIFDGVGIKGVHIYIPQFQEDIYIEEILLDQDFVNLIYLANDTAQGQTPDFDDIEFKLKLELNGLKYNATFDEKIEYEMTNALQQTGQSSSLTPKIIQVLGYKSLYDRMNDFRDLGYSTMEMDIIVSFEMDMINKQINLDYVIDTKDMYKMDFHFVLDASSSNAYNISDSVKLKEMELKYTDYSYANRLIGLMAKDNDMDIEAYREKIIDDFKADLKRNDVKLYQETVDNIIAFLKKPERLNVTMYPSSPVDFNSLDLYEPGDIPRLFNIQVYSNEE